MRDQPTSASDKRQEWRERTDPPLSRAVTATHSDHPTGAPRRIARGERNARRSDLLIKIFLKQKFLRALKLPRTSACQLSANSDRPHKGQTITATTC